MALMTANIHQPVPSLVSLSSSSSRERKQWERICLLLTSTDSRPLCSRSHCLDVPDIPLPAAQDQGGNQDADNRLSKKRKMIHKKPREDASLRGEVLYKRYPGEFQRAQPSD